MADVRLRLPISFSFPWQVVRGVQPSASNLLFRVFSKGDLVTALARARQWHTYIDWVQVGFLTLCSC